MKSIRLPKTAALLAEALQVTVETPRGSERTYDLSGRILGTDASATRLFAVRPQRAHAVAHPERARGLQARALRQAWQGTEVDQWIEVSVRAPLRPVHLGTAREIYYRSSKHTGQLTNYVHHFSSPAPAVYRAAGNFYFIGGKKHITHRGIED